MAKTNAELQQAYRERHLKDFDNSDNKRLDLVVSGPASRALKRMAARAGVSQRTMLETVLLDAELVLVKGFDREASDAYYQVPAIKKITG